MSFDPYAEWLKISTDERPPNYYQLLGLKLKESDEEKISESYRNRYSLVRKYQVGEKSVYALQLIQELSKAHDCLTSLKLKKQYDSELGEGEAAPAEAKKQTTKKKVELADVVEEEEIQELREEDVVHVPPADASIWYLITPDGMRFGPMTESDLDTQVEQGNITGDCQIWREGWPEPQLASSIYIALEMQRDSGFELVEETEAAPYEKQDPFGRTHSRGTTRAFSGLALGILVSALAVIYNVSFLWIVLGIMVTATATAITIIGWWEIEALFNAPPLTMVRARKGDAQTRGIVIQWAGRLMIVGIAVVALPTVISFGKSVTDKLAQQDGTPKNEPKADQKQDSGDSNNTQVSKSKDDENKNDKDKDGGVRLVNPQAAPRNNGSGSEERANRVAKWRVADRFPRGTSAVAVSNNEQLLAMAFTDEKVRIWDLTRATFVQTLSIGARATDVCFSPDDSEIVVATGSTAKKWRVADGHVKPPTTVSDSVGTLLARFGADGGMVVTQAKGAYLLKPDGTRGSQLLHASGFPVLAFRPGGPDFIITNPKRKLAYYTSTNGNSQSFGPTGVVQAAITADGQRIAVALQSGDVELIHVGDGGRSQVLKGFPGEINSLTISPDGKTIVVAQNGPAKLRFWNGETRRFIGTAPDSFGAINRAIFARNQMLVVATAAETLFLQPGEPRVNLRRVEDITPRGMSSDLTSNSNSGTNETTTSNGPKTWQLAQRLTVADPQGIIFHPTDENVAIVTDGKKVFNWNFSEDSTSAIAEVEQDIIQLETSQDGSLLAALQKNQITIINFATGEKRNLRSRPISSMNCVSFGPGSTLATSDVTKMVRVWNANSDESPTLFQGNSGTNAWIQFLPKTGQLVAGGRGSKVTIFNSADGSKLAELTGSGSVKSLAVREDGTIAAGFSSRTIRVWRDGNEIQSIKHPARARLNAFELLRFRPRTPVVAGHVQGGEQIWLFNIDTGRTAKPVNCQAAIRSFAFNKVGSAMVVATKNRQVTVWTLK